MRTRDVTVRNLDDARALSQCGHGGLSHNVDMPRRRHGKVEGAQSIRRAFAILRILAAGQETGARVTEVARLSRLSRSTVHRMLNVLVEEDLAEQDASRRYVIGPEASLLGLARGSALRIRQVAEPHLRALCDLTGDSAFLTVRTGLDSICIDRKSGTHPIQVLSVAVGARRPLGAGVGGVVLLAALPTEESCRIVHQNAVRLGHLGVDPEQIMERVAVARSVGYAYTQAGVVPDTRAVAVGIADRSGRAMAALSISTVSNRMPPARMRELVGAMKEQARLIAARARMRAV
jgi:DNA-binding IclR family transcriptional regulator